MPVWTACTGLSKWPTDGLGQYQWHYLFQMWSSPLPWSSLSISETVFPMWETVFLSIWFTQVLCESAEDRGYMKHLSNMFHFRTLSTSELVRGGRCSGEHSLWVCSHRHCQPADHQTCWDDRMERNTQVRRYGLVFLDTQLIIIPTPYPLIILN